ncbi:hypothetical protein L227DRAFT_577213 [Lentinus tigrinus ALCF2SS1-6]|uniref:Uncharacterized protein n=1 Tax=Lentinus tigrinus ALCF2SS1-6 TaxID=1328759 RepID=A0A5C2S5A0_9APHY|nr:hypothetical protein L227DRAFT_577213 [Lentinus tigrinus ALCF2SS1-6]
MIDNLFESLAGSQALHRSLEGAQTIRVQWKTWVRGNNVTSTFALVRLFLCSLRRGEPKRLPEHPPPPEHFGISVMDGKFGRTVSSFHTSSSLHTCAYPVPLAAIIPSSNRRYPTHHHPCASLP